MGGTRRRTAVIAASVGAAAALAAATAVWAAPGGEKASALTVARASTRTTTPIKHVVVLFDENISFDHYFGTYPKAANTDGTRFTARPGTPRVDGLTPDLLQHNPN